MADCKKCKEERAKLNKSISLEGGYDVAFAFAERTTKRLWIALLISIFMLVGTNVGWLIYESQFEVVESTVEEYVVEQNAESGNNNSIINGGEIVNGETEDNIPENNN